MKKVFVAVFLVALAMTFVVGQGKSSVKKITAKEGKKLLDAGGVTLVDVRTYEEFVESHIPNAILIPNETIGRTEPKQLSDKNATIIVYCRSGRRSAEAAQKLSSLGYKNILDMGGITSWPYEKVAGNK